MLKTIETIFVCLCLIAFNRIEAKAQTKYKVDTVYVSTGTRTFLIFPQKVDWADMGIKAYVGKKENVTLFLTAAERNLPPASLVVKYGSNVFHGTIAWKESLDPSEQIINFNEVESEVSADFVNEDRVAEEMEKSLQRQLVNRRLGILGGIDKDEEQIGHVSGKLIFKVSIMRKDADFYYFKLKLYNKSKEDYNVDFVDFTYKDRDVHSGLKLEKSHTEVPIDYFGEPFKEGDNYTSPGKGELVLYYAIKQFFVTKDGRLEITIREKKGSRVLTFKLDEGMLSKVKEY